MLPGSPGHNLCPWAKMAREENMQNSSWFSCLPSHSPGCYPVLSSTQCLPSLWEAREGVWVDRTAP